MENNIKINIEDLKLFSIEELGLFELALEDKIFRLNDKFHEQNENESNISPAYKYEQVFEKLKFYKNQVLEDNKPKTYIIASSDVSQLHEGLKDITAEQWQRIEEGIKKSSSLPIIENEFNPTSMKEKLLTKKANSLEIGDGILNLGNVKNTNLIAYPHEKRLDDDVLVWFKGYSTNSGVPFGYTKSNYMCSYDWEKYLVLTNSVSRIHPNYEVMKEIIYPIRVNDLKNGMEIVNLGIVSNFSPSTMLGYEFCVFLENTHRTSPNILHYEDQTIVYVYNNI